MHGFVDDIYLPMYNFSVAFRWVVEVKSMHFESLVHEYPESCHIILVAMENATLYGLYMLHS